MREGFQAEGGRFILVVGPLPGGPRAGRAGTMTNDEFDELVAGAWGVGDPDHDTMWWPMLFGTTYTMADVAQLLVTPCRGCGRQECGYDCDWGRCPGPDCNFEGHLQDHVEEQGQNPGYTGALIYWATYRCGFQDVDASADTLEMVR